MNTGTADLEDLRFTHARCYGHAIQDSFSPGPFKALALLIDIDRMSFAGSLLLVSSCRYRGGLLDTLGGPRAKKMAGTAGADIFVAGNPGYE